MTKIRWDRLFVYLVFLPGMSAMFWYAIYAFWKLYNGDCCG